MPSAFDKAAERFTNHMWICHHWKASFPGAAYSTRLRAAIIQARVACDELEEFLDGESK